MTTAERIKALQDLGFEVLVSHRRPVEFFTETGLLTKYELEEYRQEYNARSLSFLEKGGTTTVTIKHDGLVVCDGKAVCSKRDNFCRKTGLEYALDRAIFNALAEGLFEVVIV